jgi:hypothetical protein
MLLFWQQRLHGCGLAALNDSFFFTIFFKSLDGKPTVEHLPSPLTFGLPKKIAASGVQIIGS